MNWKELYSYTISHLKNRNCAKTVGFLKNCAAYHSKKQTYLYLSNLLAILSQGLKAKEPKRLRQLYKRKLRSLQMGELNSLSETSTDIGIQSRVINIPGSKSFHKEVDRFQREFDKKEKELLELDALFHEVDSNLIEFCNDKIEETKLLEELFPHAPAITRLLNKKKKEICQISKLQKKKDKRIKLTEKKLKYFIKEFGGIKPKHIWQEGERADKTAGRVKHMALAKNLLDSELPITDDHSKEEQTCISKRHLGRRIKKLTNTNQYSIKKQSDTYKCVT